MNKKTNVFIQLSHMYGTLSVVVHFVMLNCFFHDLKFK